MKVPLQHFERRSSSLANVAVQDQRLNLKQVTWRAAGWGSYLMGKKTHECQGDKLFSPAL